MRRSARGEQSAFSLFPFLAVLLCTMGAMVVLLVGIAHVARSKAEREAELAKAAAEQAHRDADSPERRAAEAELAKAEQHAAQLRELMEKGTQRLEQEQQRLSAVEDHLRRLRDDAERLKTETIELIAVEREHYDDEKIARQEIKRLNELIGQLEEEIEEAKHAATGRERRYAVVPLRDNASGTIRPAIYFECTSQGVVLQPEGIELGWEDLTAAKFSSPMAAASRAVTRYYEEHPEARAANEAGAPYALLIVRPDGVDAYYGARTALETVGASYGYQPVGGDWPIEYDAPNPVLAQWVDEAVQSARQERTGLARAIPQLARELNMAKLGPPSARGGSRTTLASAGQGGGGIRVSRADPEAANPFDGLRIEGSLPSGKPGGNSLTQSTTPRLGAPVVTTPKTPQLNQQTGGPGGPVSGDAQRRPTQAITQAVPSSDEGKSEQTAEAAQLAEAAATGQSPRGARQQASGQSGSTTATDSQASGSPTQAASPAAVVANNGGSNPSRRGSGSQNKGQADSRDGVPMVRPIRLYVAADRVVILPDRAQAPTAEIVQASGPQNIRFDGATTDRINEVIAALKRHADSWGIAGSGFYWDPRLILNVTGDGAARAEELAKLLDAAGLQVQAKPVATAAYPNTQGGTGATR